MFHEKYQHGVGIKIEETRTTRDRVPYIPREILVVRIDALTSEEVKHLLSRRAHFLREPERTIEDMSHAQELADDDQGAFEAQIELDNAFERRQDLKNPQHFENFEQSQRPQ